jgi:uncharacterized protein (TIGR02147 family)
MEINSPGGGDGNTPFLEPKIQNYQDYRRFIADFYLYKKNSRKGFSFRKFSGLAGFKSPNYLQLVMRGERNLSEEMSESVAQAMSLKGSGKKYFQSLVRQENAKTDEELGKAKSEGLRALKQLVAKYVNREAEEVLSKWYHLAVRELAALRDFEPEGKWISEKLNRLIDEEQAEASLQLLLRAGFLKIENNRCAAADPIIDIGDQLFSHERVAKVHVETLKQWAKIIPETTPVEQELGILTLSLPQSKIPALQQKIRDFQDEILGWLSEEPDSDQVVQVGTYMIPLTKGNRK